MMIQLSQTSHSFFKRFLSGEFSPKVLCTLSLLMLSGCSTYDGEFDCPKGEGLTCASLSDVHCHIDEGVIGEEKAPFVIKKRRGPCQKETCTSAARFSVPFYYPKKILESGEVIPARVVYVRASS